MGNGFTWHKLAQAFPRHVAKVYLSLQLIPSLHFGMLLVLYLRTMDVFRGMFMFMCPFNVDVFRFECHLKAHVSKDRESRLEALQCQIL